VKFLGGEGLAISKA